MPRFVLLQHDHPFLHWDLMLEAGDILRTWRLLEAPEPNNTIRAEPLGDHRKLYLDYEGPVSGDRGAVSRWDAGTFAWQVQEADRLVVLLEGRRLRGAAVVARNASGEWSFLLAKHQPVPKAHGA